MLLDVPQFISFANPAEALGGFDAWRLGGMQVSENAGKMLGSVWKMLGINLEDNHVTTSLHLIMIKDELFYHISLSDWPNFHFPVTP